MIFKHKIINGIKNEMRLSIALKVSHVSGAGWIDGPMGGRSLSKRFELISQKRPDFLNSRF